MKIKLTFERNFDALYRKFLNSENGHALLTLEGISPEQIDIGSMSHRYFTDLVQDMSVDANANANGKKSINSYQAEITKGILKLEGYYLLWRYTKKRLGRKRADELLWKIWSGQLYFHDASGANIQVPYCWAFSTTPLMVEGRPYGQLHSMPANKAESFIGQVIETTMDLSQDFAGAVAPADLIVNYAYFAKREGRSDKQIVDDLQKFVHVMNNGFRVGGQSPFVNISLFDRPNLEKVFGEAIYPDGTSPDFEYVMKVQKLFGEWFAKGDPKSGLPYRFPVVTVNLHKDAEGNVIDKDFLKWVSRTNIHKGCFNIYINDGYKVASCCRLVNDRSKLRADSFGNGGLNIGSHRVVTINLPRVAMDSKAQEVNVFQLLGERLNDAFDLLQTHRHEIMRRRVRDGICKFFHPIGWFNMDDLFSVVGMVGIHEMTEIMGHDILTEEGQTFVSDILDCIETRLREFAEQTELPWSCEEIPAESAAGKLAMMDKLTYDHPYELYSNQYVPLIKQADVLTRLEIAGRFQSKVSGGGILHININSQIMTEEQMEALIIAAVKAGVQHFAINYGFGICEHGHTSIVGNSDICPVCGAKITDWLTRVIGYFTFVSSWNKVRRVFEYGERKFTGGNIHV